ncbi:MAG: hypothetical protein N4A72_08900 [Bacteroidales bacterium]|jgi:hypothetical protein|nr:hypothetical protein [Bacteroidales bacterium]
MQQIKYFSLSPTTETKEIGVWEQIDVVDYNRDTLLVKDLAYRSFPDSIPDFSGFKVKNGARYTDIMSSFLPTKSIGVFVSDKLKQLIESENLYAGRFYPALSVREDYWFLHIIDKATDIVDFKKSDFIDFSEDNRYVEIDEEDYECLPDFVEPKKIVLKHMVDIFRSPYNIEVLISERFKDVLEKHNITGTYIQEYDSCEFFTDN